jgi:hypothetical protein
MQARGDLGGLSADKFPGLGAIRERRGRFEEVAMQSEDFLQRIA